MKTKPEAISYIIAKLEMAKISSDLTLKKNLLPFQVAPAIAVSFLVFANARTTVLEAIQIAKSVPNQITKTFPICKRIFFYHFKFCHDIWNHFSQQTAFIVCRNEMVRKLISVCNIFSLFCFYIYKLQIWNFFFHAELIPSSNN